jgi:hypothetical protein
MKDKNHHAYGKPAANRGNITKEIFDLILFDVKLLKEEKAKAVTIDRALGAKYNLSSGLISSIRTGKHWSNQEFGGISK